MIYWIFPGEFSRQLINTNQAISLAHDIAVKPVIGLHKSDHVSDVICASVL